jgi:hypothetical protein
MLDTNDFILISVDDHIIEPPDLFVHHLAARGHDVSTMSRSPRGRTPDERLEGFRKRAQRAVVAGT